MRIVNENIWIALAVKVIILVLSAFGIADMWIAVFGDVGVLILAVLNAMRAMLKIKNNRPTKTAEGDSPFRRFLCLAELPALCSPDSVYVPLEVAAVEKLGQHQLFECRHGAGVEAEPLFKCFDESLRQNHISHAH